MLRTAFRIPLHQAEGLMASVFTLMKVSLNVPDHTTVSRRAAALPPLPHIPAEGTIHVLIDSTGLTVYGAGQWLEEKPGVRARRDWRKLHLAVDADNFSIVAHTLTDLLQKKIHERRKKGAWLSMSVSTICRGGDTLVVTRITKPA